MFELAAQLLGGGRAGNRIDHRMLHGRDAPAVSLHALQHRQLLACGQRLAVKLGHLLERGVQCIKSRRERLPINTTTSHAAKLTKRSDKNRRPETPETKVTQVISADAQKPQIVSQAGPDLATILQLS